MSVSTSTTSSGSVGVYSTESPGSCPNRDTGIRSGHGWLRCGGTNSAELAATVEFTLQAALQTWLGDVITVRRVVVSADDARLSIDIGYLVKATGESASTTFTRAV